MTKISARVFRAHEIFTEFFVPWLRGESSAVDSHTDSINLKKRSAVYVIVLLCLLAYFNTLGNGFLNYDDYDERILKNPFLVNPWQWSHIVTAFTQATAGYYDPVYVLSYVIDHQLWGFNPAGFHLGNVLLHAVNSVLVFQLLLRLTGRFSLSFLAAALFAIHPIHVESVSWATSRKDTLSLLLALGSILVYFSGVAGGLKKYTACAAGSIALLLLGMMTKPTVVVAPFIIFLTELFLRDRPLEWKRTLAYQSVASVALAVYVFLTLPMTLGIAVKPEIQFSPVANAMLFFDLYRYFLKLIVFPFNLSAFYLIAAAQEFSGLMAASALAVLLGVAGWFLYEIVRAIKISKETVYQRPALWGAGVFLVGLLPFTNVLPRTIYLADRYEYLASIGFCLAVSAGLMAIPARAVRVFAMTLLLVAYSALSMQRIPVWKDSPALWADVDQKRNIPAAEHHRIMGGAHAFEGEWQKALAEYEKAGVDSIPDPQELLKVANIYATVGNIGQAESVIQKTLLKYPDYLPAMDRLIILQLVGKKYEEASETLKGFQEKFTATENTLFRNLIRYDQKGQLQEATEVYRELQNSIGSRTRNVSRQDHSRRHSGA